MESNIKVGGTVLETGHVRPKALAARRFLPLAISNVSQLCNTSDREDSGAQYVHAYAFIAYATRCGLLQRVCVLCRWLCCFGERASGTLRCARRCWSRCVFFPLNAVAMPTGHILGAHVCTCATKMGWDRAEAVLKATLPVAIRRGCTKNLWRSSVGFSCILMVGS